MLAAVLSLGLAASELDRNSLFKPLIEARTRGSEWRTQHLLNEALEKAAAAHDTLATSALLAAMGWMNHTEAHPQRALSYFENALRALQESGTATMPSSVQLPDLLQGQTKDYGSRHREPSADFEFWEPIYPPDLTKTVDVLPLLESGLMLNIGTSYALQAQNDIAKRWLDASHTIAMKARLSLIEQSALTNLAWLAFQSANTDEFVAALDAATTIGGGLKPSKSLKSLWLLHGVRLREQRRYAEAITILNTAVALYEQAGGEERGRPLSQLATALALSGHFTEARISYERALAKSPNDFETQWHSYCGVAALYRQEGLLSRAVAAYQECVQRIQERAGEFGTDQGKVSFLGGFDALYNAYLDTMIAYAQGSGDWAKLRSSVESVRGRSTDALIAYRERKPLGTPGLLSAYDLGLWKYEVMQQQMQSARAEPSPENISPEIPSNDPAFRNSDAWQRVRTRVTFLEYYVLPKNTVIMVHTAAGQIHCAISTLGRDQIRTLVQSYRNAIGQDNSVRGLQIRRASVAGSGNESSNSAASGAALYRELIRPVETSLPGPNELLVIVPHDALWEVPFEALPVDHGGFLVDRFLTAYASSSSRWLTQAAKLRVADHRSARAWVVGNPRIPGPVEACGSPTAFEPLAGAEQEAREIRDLFGVSRADLFIGSAADRLRLLAWHPNYSVLHIAAHGFACSQDPQDSALVLASLNQNDVQIDSFGHINLVSDRRLPLRLTHPQITPKEFVVSGLLTAREIASRFRFQADLVFLSACQSGVGAVSGEGQLGFTRAFEGAGARSVVLSLWLVGDDSAHLFTREFYREYLRHGKKAVAMQTAMLATRHQYPDPADWAAFRLLGPSE